MISIQLSDYAPLSSDNKRRFQWDEAQSIIKSPIGDNVLKSNDSELFFSLEGFDYIEADGLLWLLLIGDYLQDKGKLMWLELPSDRKQLQFIKSTLFVNAAQELFTITNLFYLDAVRVNKPAFSDIPSYFNFLNVDINSVSLISYVFLIQNISRVLNLRPTAEMEFEIMQPFANLIIETNRNLVQHSRPRNGDGQGFFVLSVSHRRNGNLLKCVLGDCGMGFNKSLQNKGLVSRNDIDAIKNALLFRYHNQEGAGLFNAVQFASRLEGVVKIRSGWSSAFLNFSKAFLQDREQVQNFINSKTYFRDEKTYFPGVQVYIEAREIK